MRLSATPQSKLEHEVVSLYEAHADGLLRYAISLLGRQYEARDALQETFLRYSIERSYGGEIDNPQAWLDRVLHNWALDWMDRAAVRWEVLTEKADASPGRKHNPGTLVHHAQITHQLAALLLSRELECVLLRAEGPSYQHLSLQVCLVLGSSVAIPGFNEVAPIPENKSYKAWTT
jgi:RNA polymerase sigma-70 factor, ECF subfamily